MSLWGWVSVEYICHICSFPSSYVWIAFLSGRNSLVMVLPPQVEVKNSNSQPPLQLGMGTWPLSTSQKHSWRFWSEVWWVLQGASIFTGVTTAETFGFEAFSGCEIEFLVTSSNLCQVGMHGEALFTALCCCLCVFLGKDLDFSASLHLQGSPAELLWN